MKEFITTLADVLKTDAKTFYQWLLKNTFLLEYVITLFVVYYILCYDDSQIHITFHGALILFILTYLIHFINAITLKLRSETKSGFPLPRRTPLTIVDDDGLVSINEENEVDTVLYLQTVDEYLRVKGYIKSDL